MKKTAFIAFAALFMFTVVFAQENETKKWTNNAGPGLSVPFSKYNADGGKIDQTGIAVSLMYLGMHQNGFTVKATVNTGISLTNSIAFAGDDGIRAGSFAAIELGAGYSFIRNEKFTLSVLGMLGLEAARYESEAKSYKHEELGAVDRRMSATIAAFTVGADITASLYIKPHFGFFGSLSARYMPLSAFVSSLSYVKDDFTRTENYTKAGHGIFSLTPAAGVIWRW